MDLLNAPGTPAARARLIAAALALSVPALVFAANAFISFRERGFPEPLDAPLAVAFGALAVLIVRRSRAAALGAVVLTAVHLVAALPAGIHVIPGFWLVALLLATQAIPLTGRSRDAGAPA